MNLTKWILLTLTVLRDGDSQDIDVTLGARPDDTSASDTSSSQDGGSQDQQQLPRKTETQLLSRTWTGWSTSATQPAAVSSCNSGLMQLQRQPSGFA